MSKISWSSNVVVYCWFVRYGSVRGCGKIEENRVLSTHGNSIAVKENDMQTIATMKNKWLLHVREGGR